MQVNALTIKNQKALKKHSTPNISTQLTICEILHSQLTVFYQLFRRTKAHKKYCTPGYAAVNHCIAHHLLLVKANGCCVAQEC